MWKLQLGFVKVMDKFLRIRRRRGGKWMYCANKNISRCCLKTVTVMVRINRYSVQKMYV